MLGGYDTKEHEKRMGIVRCPTCGSATTQQEITPPPRGGDAAEKELGALLERLAEESYEVMFRKFTGEMAGMIGPYGAFSVGFIEEPRKDIISGGATPLAALQALDAALAEQQQQKSEESSRNENAGANG